jgi:hypothetical protein
MSRISGICTTENTEVTEKIIRNLSPAFFNSLMLRAPRVLCGDIGDGQ